MTRYPVRLLKKPLISFLNSAHIIFALLQVPESLRKA